MAIGEAFLGPRPKPGICEGHTSAIVSRSPICTACGLGRCVRGPSSAPELIRLSTQSNRDRGRSYSRGSMSPPAMWSDNAARVDLLGYEDLLAEIVDLEGRSDAAAVDDRGIRRLGRRKSTLPNLAATERRGSRAWSSSSPADGSSSVTTTSSRVCPAQWLTRSRRRAADLLVEVIVTKPVDSVVVPSRYAGEETTWLILHPTVQIAAPP